MGRNYFKGRDGDRINAVLAAAGYSFRLLPRSWLERLLRASIRALLARSMHEGWRV
jgi:IS5 family transposase